MRADYLIDKVWSGKSATFIRYRFTSGPMDKRTITIRYTADHAFESFALPKGVNQDGSRSGSQKA